MCTVFVYRAHSNIASFCFRVYLGDIRVYLAGSWPSCILAVFAGVFGYFEALIISGEEGSVRAAVVATAMSEAAPIGWVDPRGHVERKKANSARRSEIWATNTSIPTYGRCVQ